MRHFGSRRLGRRRILYPPVPLFSIRPRRRCRLPGQIGAVALPATPAKSFRCPCHWAFSWKTSELTRRPSSVLLLLAFDDFRAFRQLHKRKLLRGNAVELQQIFLSVARGSAVNDVLHVVTLTLSLWALAALCSGSKDS